MDCEPYIGELLAAKSAEERHPNKYVLGMLVEINSWDYDERYKIQWFDDYTICDYNESDYNVFRDRMAKVRREYGL